MPIQNDYYLPSYEELTVPEMKISYPFFKAAVFHLGKFCDNECKEFMLCRSEEADPRKCLKEGKVVTACGIKFFQKVKKHCREEFERLAHCMDHKTPDLYHWPCLQFQRPFDNCMLEKLGVEKPSLGYFSRPRVHQTDRPKPERKQRDYEKEAAELITDLPEDWPVKKEWRAYHSSKAGWGWWPA